MPHTKLQSIQSHCFYLCEDKRVISVVAEFIIQSESAEQISVALAVIKRLNPTWNPSYFMMNYSDAEMAAVQNVFPSTQIFVCDFHCEQAWEMGERQETWPK